MSAHIINSPRGTSRLWLQALGLDRPPFNAVEAPLWVNALYLTAIGVGAVDANPVLEVRVRPQWTRFYVLVERDAVLRESIEAVTRLGDYEAFTTFVQERFNELHAKLGTARRFNEMQAVQETRKRRIEGRVSGITGEPWQRPSDKDFDREARGLKPRRKR